MKITAVICLSLLVFPMAARADQLEERMERAAKIQEAEENAKLCQLGSPACKGGSTARLPMGGPGLPPVPSGSPSSTGLAPSGAAEMPVATTSGDQGAAPVADSRPKAVGMSIVGGQKSLEVRYRGAFATLREGDTLGGWKLVSIAKSGATWERNRARSTSVRAASVAQTSEAPVVSKPTAMKTSGTAKRKNYQEKDAFGTPSVTAPVAIK